MSLFIDVSHQEARERYDLPRHSLLLANARSLTLLFLSDTICESPWLITVRQATQMGYNIYDSAK